MNFSNEKPNKIRVFCSRFKQLLTNKLCKNGGCAGTTPTKLFNLPFLFYILIERSKDFNYVDVQKIKPPTTSPRA
jgi:hypothetical protein